MDADERGYSGEEIERGEDQAWHIPIVGCLVFIALATLAIYGLYHLAIRQGVAWSIG